MTRTWKFSPPVLAAGVTPLLLLLAGGAVAQEPARAPGDTIIPIEGVVVSTVRPAATTGGSSAVVAAPDSLRLGPAPTLAQALRELPFVAVRENSRGQAEITVRGSDSRQVAVLLDGVPLSLGWDHRTDPSIIPITGARTITLVRGLHSVLYGPNVLGGVVEVGMSTSAGPPPPPYRVSLGADQHGAFSAAATASHPLTTLSGDWSVTAGAGIRRRSALAVAPSAGDTLSGTPGLRANSDLRHTDAFVSARFEAISGAWGGVSASGYRAERGVPPELHVERPRLWRYPGESRSLVVASGGSGERRTPWGTGDVEVSVGLDRVGTRIESFQTAGYDVVTGAESGDGRTATLRLLADHTVPGGGTLTGAATAADVRHREVIDDGAAATYRQRLWSIASEVSVPFGRGGTASGGISLDGSDTPESGGKPPLGSLAAWGGRLGISSLLGGRSRVHAAVSRRARFPSLRELYSGALGRFEPNPALRPETLLGVEAGVTMRTPAADLQIVAFRHRLSDAVVRTATPDGRYRRVNRDAIRSIGVELLGDVGLGPLRVRGDLTAQRVAVSRPGAGDPLHAEHQPDIRGSFAADAPLPGALTAIAVARYTGSQYCVHPDAGGEVRLDPDAGLDLGLRRLSRLGGAPLRLSAFLTNATDAALHDQCGLPRPGRTLRFSVELG